MCLCGKQDRHEKSCKHRLYHRLFRISAYGSSTIFRSIPKNGGHQWLSYLLCPAQSLRCDLVSHAGCVPAASGQRKIFRNDALQLHDPFRSTLLRRGQTYGRKSSGSIDAVYRRRNRHIDSGQNVLHAPFPENPQEKKLNIDIVKAVGISIRNSALVSYSVYVCLLSLAYTSLIPVTLLYLKNYVGLDAGKLQIFSTIGIAGSITGFFCYGFIQKKFKIKRLELFVHFVFMAVALCFALLSCKVPGFIYLAGVIYFINSFANSVFMCNNSTELLALARPGNKTMAMAFQQTYHNAGISISRAGTAMVLGANLLAPSWQLGSLTLCSYQTLFLFYGITAAILLILIPTLPAVVPKRRDYYEP